MNKHVQLKEVFAIFLSIIALLINFYYGIFGGMSENNFLIDFIQNISITGFVTASIILCCISVIGIKMIGSQKNNLYKLGMFLGIYIPIFIIFFYIIILPLFK